MYFLGSSQGKLNRVIEFSQFLQSFFGRASGTSEKPTGSDVFSSMDASLADEFSMALESQLFDVSETDGGTDKQSDEFFETDEQAEYSETFSGLGLTPLTAEEISAQKFSERSSFDALNQLTDAEQAELQALMTQVADEVSLNPEKYMEVSAPFSQEAPHRLEGSVPISSVVESDSNISLVASSSFSDAAGKIKREESYFSRSPLSSESLESVQKSRDDLVSVENRERSQSTLSESHSFRSHGEHIGEEGNKIAKDNVSTDQNEVFSDKKSEKVSASKLESFYSTEPVTETPVNNPSETFSAQDLTEAPQPLDTFMAQSALSPSAPSFGSVEQHSHTQSSIHSVSKMGAKTMSRLPSSQSVKQQLDFPFLPPSSEPSSFEGVGDDLSYAPASEGIDVEGSFPSASTVSSEQEVLLKEQLPQNLLRHDSKSNTPLTSMGVLDRNSDAFENVIRSEKTIQTQALLSTSQGDHQKSADLATSWSSRSSSESQQLMSSHVGLASVVEQKADKQVSHNADVESALSADIEKSQDIPDIRLSMSKDSKERHDVALHASKPSFDKSTFSSFDVGRSVETVAEHMQDVSLKGQGEDSKYSGRDSEHVMFDKSSQSSVSSSVSTQPSVSSLTSMGQVQPLQHISPSGAALKLNGSVEQSVANQAVQATLNTLETGQTEMTLQLAPEHLGEMEVQLVSQADQSVRAIFKVSSPEAMEALKGQMDSMKQTLEEQSVRMDNIQIMLAGSSETSNQGQSQQQPGGQLFGQEGLFDSSSQTSSNDSSNGFQQAFDQSMGQSGQSLNHSSRQGASQAEPGQRQGGQESSHQMDEKSSGQMAQAHSTDRVYTMDEAGNKRISVLV